MTVQECACRDEQARKRIECSLRVDNSLAAHADDLSIEMTADGVVVNGFVPSPHLVSRIVPMIRRAGVLSQVENLVQVA